MVEADQAVPVGMPEVISLNAGIPLFAVWAVPAPVVGKVVTEGAAVFADAGELADVVAAGEADACEDGAAEDTVT